MFSELTNATFHPHHGTATLESDNILKVVRQKKYSQQ
jgi:hypothetical protein